MGQGICLVLWEDEQGCIRRFELSGHAGYADHGKDIVCAGVTALGFASVNGLEHFLPQALRVTQGEDGYLDCQFGDISEDELNQAQWILQTMKLGIEGIQKEYGPKYIMIETRRWTPC